MQGIVPRYEFECHAGLDLWWLVSCRGERTVHMAVCRLCERLFVCKRHAGCVCPDCKQFRGFLRRVMEEQKKFSSLVSGERIETNKKQGEANESRLQAKIDQRVRDAQVLENSTS